MAATTKKGKTADDEDAASDIPDDNNNNDLEPMKACHDPFPTAAVLRVSGSGAEDALPEEYREHALLMALPYVSSDSKPGKWGKSISDTSLISSKVCPTAMPRISTYLSKRAV